MTVQPEHTEPQPAGKKEIEWQLAADDLGTVQQWLTEHKVIDGFTIEPRPSQRIYDTYLDTDDWRVHRAGFALRVRDLPGHSEATLKELAGSADGPKIRREINELLSPAEGDPLAHGNGPVSTRVRALAGMRALRPLFRVRTHRQRYAVLREDREAAEVVLDKTLLASPDGRHKADLQRVEVEALSEPPQVLHGLVEQLRAGCALQPAKQSKYEAGLASAGLHLPAAADLGPTAIDPALSIAEIARANLRRSLSRWLACEPGARLSENTEDLHELRIAVRQLDVYLRLFGDYLPRALAGLRPRLKEVLRALGAVRDLDVQLERLAAFSSASNETHPGDGERLQPLRARLEAERAAARKRMLQVLDRLSTQRIVERLRTALAKPTRATAPGNAPAAVVAPDLIRSSYKKLRKAAARIHDQSTPEELHAVRRRAKRLRYTLHAFEGFYGEAADGILRALRRLQDVLGEHQDAQVAAKRLMAMVEARTRKLTPATAFAAGICAEREQALAAKMRRRFPKACRRISGRRWKSLNRAMGAEPS